MEKCVMRFCIESWRNTNHTHHDSSRGKRCKSETNVAEHILLRIVRYRKVANKWQWNKSRTVCACCVCNVLAVNSMKKTNNTLVYSGSQENRCTI